MLRAVDSSAPTHMAAKTAPLCSMLKWWFVPKTSGMLRKVRYRTAQLKATHKEKKKTTGSVARRSKFEKKI